MISKSLKKTQNVSVMYDWSNKQGQRMIQHNVWRVSCGKDRREEEGGVGERNCFLTVISCYYVLFDGVYPVGSTGAKGGGGGWKRGTTKQKCIFFSSTLSIFFIIGSNRN